MKQADTKMRLERELGDLLCKQLNYPLSFERHGDPNEKEPDLVYRQSNGTSDTSFVGIEVTVAYYGEADARQLWTLIREERQAPQIEKRWGGVIIEPDQKMVKQIQMRVNKKCSRQYRGCDELWLLIYAVHPLADDYFGFDVERKLVIPRQSDFSRLFVSVSGRQLRRLR